MNLKNGGKRKKRNPAFLNSLPSKAKTPSNLHLKGFCVPRAGVEPARV